MYASKLYAMKHLLFPLVKLSNATDMKLKKILLIVLLLTIVPKVIMVGNDCNKTHKKCKSPDSSFEISSSSRPIKLYKGKKARVALNVYGGRTYFFSFYSKPKVGSLHFKITNPNSNKIIYDNSTEALTDHKTFKFKSTQKLYIEITAPNWKSDKRYECSGIKIAYKKS